MHLFIAHPLFLLPLVFIVLVVVIQRHLKKNVQLLPSQTKHSLPTTLDALIEETLNLASLKQIQVEDEYEGRSLSGKIYIASSQQKSCDLFLSHDNLISNDAQSFAESLHHLAHLWQHQQNKWLWCVHHFILPGYKPFYRIGFICVILITVSLLVLGFNHAAIFSTVMDQLGIGLVILCALLIYSRSLYSILLNITAKALEKDANMQVCLWIQSLPSLSEGDRSKIKDALMQLAKNQDCWRIYNPTLPHIEVI